MTKVQFFNFDEPAKAFRKYPATLSILLVYKNDKFIDKHFLFFNNIPLNVFIFVYILP